MSIAWLQDGWLLHPQTHVQVRKKKKKAEEKQGRISGPYNRNAEVFQKSQETPLYVSLLRIVSYDSS